MGYFRYFLNYEKVKIDKIGKSRPGGRPFSSDSVVALAQDAYLGNPSNGGKPISFRKAFTFAGSSIRHRTMSFVDGSLRTR